MTYRRPGIEITVICGVDGCNGRLSIQALHDSDNIYAMILRFHDQHCHCKDKTEYETTEGGGFDGEASDDA